MTETKNMELEASSDFRIDSPRKATFTLSELDHRRAGRLHIFSSMRDPRTIIKLSILLIGMVVAFHTCLWLIGVSWTVLVEKLPLFVLLMAVVTFGTPVVLSLLFGPIVIRRRFRQEKLLRKPVSVRWDEEVFEADQPGIHNRIQWSDYMKWREDRHQFLFFMSDYMYQILPKRVLSKEQIDDIRAILSGYSNVS